MRQRARGLRSLSSVRPGSRPATSPDVATLRASDPQPAAAIRRAGSNWRNLGSPAVLGFLAVAYLSILNFARAFSYASASFFDLAPCYGSFSCVWRLLFVVPYGSVVILGFSDSHRPLLSSFWIFSRIQHVGPVVFRFFVIVVLAVRVRSRRIIPSRRARASPARGRLAA